MAARAIKYKHCKLPKHCLDIILFSFQEFSWILNTVHIEVQVYVCTSNCTHGPCLCVCLCAVHVWNVYTLPIQNSTKSSSSWHRQPSVMTKCTSPDSRDASRPCSPNSYNFPLADHMPSWLILLSAKWVMVVETYLTSNNKQNSLV